MTRTIPAPVEAFDKEVAIKRNPHADFGSVEASRPQYKDNQVWTPSKAPNPKWKPGDGGSDESWRHEKVIDIDPNAEGRPAVYNYKLMISSTVPRPIALVSTVSKDGKSTNLAPFSYFQNVCSDPPLYSISFIGSEPCDTLRNILETGELCISIITDHFVEAANYTSTNTPPGTSEWALSGLHASPSKIITPTYVSESPFSIEARLVSHQAFHSHQSGAKTAVMVVVEAVQWHVRESAINAEHSTVDVAALRPVWRAGGITYGTAFAGFELLRPEAFRVAREREGVRELVREKIEGQ